MGYTLEDIRASQEIFCYLLEKHELRAEEAPLLFKAYTESEDVQALLSSQGEAADCDIERYMDVVYLIPKEGNRYLGFSKPQLKKELCRHNATDRDYYLALFSILTLLLEFYDGTGSSSKMRDYIRVGELQNSISNHLKEGAEKYSETEQDLYGIAFTDMLHAYEALKSDDRGSRQKTTKEGFLFNILKFMEGQGLVMYMEQDEMVKTTRKLDHFMDWNLLNRNNYAHVQSVLGEEKDE